MKGGVDGGEEKQSANCEEFDKGERVVEDHTFKDHFLFVDVRLCFLYHVSVESQVLLLILGNVSNNVSFELLDEGFYDSLLAKFRQGANC